MTGRPNLSRETKFLGSNRDKRKEKNLFLVEFTTSRICNLTPVDPCFVISDDNIYIHTYTMIVLGAQKMWQRR